VRRGRQLLCGVGARGGWLQQDEEGRDGGKKEGSEAGGEYMDSAEELVLFNALGRRGHDEDVVPHNVAVAVPSAHVQHAPACPPVLSHGPAPPRWTHRASSRVAGTSAQREGTGCRCTSMRPNPRTALRTAAHSLHTHTHVADTASIIAPVSALKCCLNTYITRPLRKRSRRQRARTPRTAIA
jgi:hypothetical protein